MSFPFLWGILQVVVCDSHLRKAEFVTFMTAAVEECDFFFLPSVRLI
jgi:hypothetical protein